MSHSIDKMKLQPLRIPGGWVVEKNEFFEFEPGLAPGSPGFTAEMARDYLDDELFVAMLPQNGALIDLGWKPAYEESGRFIVRLVWPTVLPDIWVWPLGNVDYDWLNATVLFESSSQQETVKRLEEILLEIRSQF